MGKIEVERRGAVALVSLSNPERRNALTLEMREAVLDAFRGFVGDDDVRAVVVAGEGDAFCAGADVGAMGGRDIAGARTRMKTMHAMIRAVHGLDKPVVAAAHGLDIGAGAERFAHARQHYRPHGVVADEAAKGVQQRLAHFQRHRVLARGVVDGDEGHGPAPLDVDRRHGSCSFRKLFLKPCRG
jgi:enoyl-CoA hydratase/carnithine racemase